MRKNVLGWFLACFLACSLAGSGHALTLQVSDHVEPPESLNPLTSWEIKSETILGHVYDSLVAFDPDGNLIPALAERWRRIDPTRVRFQLRRGVRFHDGEPFDARAVVGTFARIRELGPLCKRGFLFAHVAVEVRGDHELDLVTAYPDGTLLHRLASFLWILPPDRLARLGLAGFERDACGTGPYRVLRFAADGSLELEAFPQAWGGRPAFEGVVFHFLPEAEQVRRLLDGRLDLVGEVPPLEFRRIQESGKATLIKADALRQVNAVLNTRRGPMADPRVRRALAASLHVDDLIRYVARGNGRKIEGSGLPGQVGWEPDRPVPAFDPELSRRLLAEVGGERPLVLRALVDPKFALLGEAMRAQAAKVGFDLRIETGSRDQLTREVVVPNLTGGEPWGRDLFVFACPDPTYHYFFINQITHHGRGPFNMWRNPEYDARFDAMVGESEPAGVARQCRELDHLVDRERPTIHLYQVRVGYAVGPRLDFRTCLHGNLDLRWSTPKQGG